jgi:CspA family cold shock protein
MAIFVNGFDFDTHEDAIADHFGAIGRVSDVRLVGKGGAVVRYDDPSCAEQAVREMDESVIPGNRRFVNVKLDGEKGKGKKGDGKKGDGKGYSDRGKGGKGGKRWEEKPPYIGEFQEGTVAKFLTDRGFGYITPDEGDGNIFVHFSAIQSSGFRELSEGQRVRFGVEDDPKGKGKGSRAVAVSVC